MLEVRDRLSDIVELATGLKLTPRQIHEVFRVMGHAMAGVPEKRGKLLWGFGAGTILMSALAVAKPELYRRMGTASAGIQDFELLLSLFSNARHREWWALVLYTGYCSGDQEANERLLSEFIRVSAIPQEMSDKANRRQLGEFTMGWSRFRSEPGLQHVYNVLEGIKSFGV